MTILLLDGHNLLYRSFTSLPRSITGPDGIPINGLYGMLSVILKLTRDLDATHVVAAFDVPDTETFRHRLFPNYQAQRGPLGGEYASEFETQVEMASRVLPALNIPAITSAGHEADDVLGTLSRRTCEGGDIAVIVSTDRDLLQLVRRGVEVFVPGNPPARVSTADEVVARIGVRPEGVATYKALAGDASDNIPGVKGIGAKTAVNLVNSFASLEAIYENLTALPTRTAILLEAQRNEAFIFRDVVTVVTNLDLNIDLSSLPAVDFSAGDRARSILETHNYGRERKGDGTPGGIRTPDL